MPGAYLIWLEAPAIASEAKPGQFVMVPCGEDTLLPRPLSIHQLDGDKIALLLNVVGKGTEWLSQRQTGDSLGLFGPLGNGFIISPNSKNLLLVAGGMGIAPLYFLAQHALKQGCSIKLLLGASTATQLYPRHLLPDDTELIVTTEDGTADQKGLITSLLPDFIDWVDQIFACGPTPMYQAMAHMPELKNKPTQVSLEVRMGCGRGVCYGCTIKTKSGLKKVCEHGPVFDLDDIIWDELNYF
ncbi:dihydroorotate dehydrogenase electron transfer subunit [Chloroflexota bacterium]